MGPRRSLTEAKSDRGNLPVESKRTVMDSGLASVALGGGAALTRAPRKLSHVCSRHGRVSTLRVPIIGRVAPSLNLPSFPRIASQAVVTEPSGIPAGCGRCLRLSRSGVPYLAAINWAAWPPFPPRSFVVLVFPSTSRCLRPVICGLRCCLLPFLEVFHISARL